ncbi:MAG: zf-TFIIB domain-containing protein [Peptococcaceae bacterium]|nr:zf-TFIIB domain-containing protein [Peptococcaceae bacterium]
MLCPACGTVEMHEVAKQGVLIDVCPRCRGVWLDRGELEKLLSAGRSAHQDYDEIYGDRHRPGETRPREVGHKYDRHHDHDNYKHKKHRKKKSFFDIFEEIFD